MPREQHRRADQRQSADQRQTDAPTRETRGGHPGRHEQRRREVEDAASGPVEIELLLSGLDFPATRREMIGHARDMACHRVVVLALRDLPERSYRSASDVMREIGNFM
ncbi:MAG: DUF2795 domain-containing protein [Phycisphaerales bacterium]